MHLAIHRVRGKSFVDPIRDRRSRDCRCRFNHPLKQAFDFGEHAVRVEALPLRLVATVVVEIDKAYQEAPMPRSGASSSSN
jgi:hypothetical protein